MAALKNDKTFINSVRKALESAAAVSLARSPALKVPAERFEMMRQVSYPQYLNCNPKRDTLVSAPSRPELGRSPGPESGLGRTIFFITNLPLLCVT
jgi:hypothetical protein